MGVADTFPVERDHGSPLGVDASGLAQWEATGGERLTRIERPLARVWQMQARARSAAEKDQLVQFYLARQGDFFIYVDPVSNRHFAMEFAGAPSWTSQLDDSWDLAWTLREAVGKPIDVYPTTPLLTIALNPVDTGDGWLYIYSGFGYKLTGTGIGGVELDGVAGMPLGQKFDVPLGAHALKVTPAGASVTKLEVVS